MYSVLSKQQISDDNVGDMTHSFFDIQDESETLILPIRERWKLEMLC